MQDASDDGSAGPLASTVGASSEGRSSRPIASLAVPLIGSLVQTYGALWLTGTTPWSNTLTWWTLVRSATVYLVITAAAHMVAVRLNRRLFPSQIDAPVPELLAAVWPSVVWVPLLILLLREDSMWMAAIPPLIAFSAVLSVKRWSGITNDDAVPQPIATLLDWPRPISLPRTLVPALVLSVTLQIGLLALVLGRVHAAGWFFALAAGTLATLLPATTNTLPRGTAQQKGHLVRAMVPRTLLVFLLLALALIPYLQSRFLTGSLAALNRNRAPGRKSAHARPKSLAPNNAYSGIILVLPPKPKQHTVIVAPSFSAQMSSASVRPVLIPFDGTYWYFRQPDPRPRPDAPIVRADPAIKTIQSTDLRPLSMEAHQRLDVPVSLACCRSLQLTVRNAEPGSRVISVQVLLSDTLTNPPATLSLGTHVLAPSVLPHSSSPVPGAEESLSYAIPKSVRQQRFNEITVVIQPPHGEARVAAHVAIESFRLLP